ncbi:MAG: hypothetical protein RR672_04420, partial [Raoultibacter sp.]
MSIGESSTYFSTENGILYTKDKTTLVAVPAGYGDAVVINEPTTTIASLAFANMTLKSIIVRSDVTSINPDSFTDATKADAVVVFSDSVNKDAAKDIW